MSQGSPGSDEPGLTGAVVDQRFVVGQPIGSGRGAVVYDAREKGGGPVVLKVLRPALSRSRMHVDRFLESARTTQSLSHPGIVDVLAVGQIPNHSAYFAMEKLAGQTIREWVNGRAIAWARARPIIAAVCEAMAAAHAASLVHGALDAKRCWVLPPANTGEEPRVKITDFGIAGEGSGPEIWPAEPPYRAPERRQGEPASARGDVFAIGALVFEILTGRAPKPGEKPQPPGGNLPGELLDTIQKAIERDPNWRFADAGALADALIVFDANGRKTGLSSRQGPDTRSPPAKRSGPPSVPPPSLDEEDVTMVRSDRRPPSVPPPGGLPALAAAAARASADRPLGAPTAKPRASGLPGRPVQAPAYPTPPPMLRSPNAATASEPPTAPSLAGRKFAPPPSVSPPASPSPSSLARKDQPPPSSFMKRPPTAPPRSFVPEQAEPEDQTSVQGGGFRFKPTEETSILPAPEAPPDPRAAPVSDPVSVDVGGEYTAVVEFRPPVSGGASRGDTGIHAITRRPPGAPREETAILDVGASPPAPRDLALTTAILEVPAGAMMRESTQILGMDTKGAPQPMSPGISMTAVIEGPFEDISSGSVVVSAGADRRDLAPSPGIAASTPAPGAHAPAFARPAAAPSAAYPAIGGPQSHPPSGAHPPLGGMAPQPHPASGAYPASGAHPPTGGYTAPSGGYPASTPPTPASGGYTSTPAPVGSNPGHRPRRRRSDHGMVIGVALGILLAVAILGGGVVAGLWVASQ